MDNFPDITFCHSFFSSSCPFHQDTQYSCFCGLTINTPFLNIIFRIWQYLMNTWRNAPVGPSSRSSPFDQTLWFKSEKSISDLCLTPLTEYRCLISDNLRVMQKIMNKKKFIYRIGPSFTNLLWDKCPHTSTHLLFPENHPDTISNITNTRRLFPLHKKSFKDPWNPEITPVHQM